MNVCIPLVSESNDRVSLDEESRHKASEFLVDGNKEN